jgi:hypothetical protein
VPVPCIHVFYSITVLKCKMNFCSCPSLCSPNYNTPGPSTPNKEEIPTEESVNTFIEEPQTVNIISLSESQNLKVE